MHMIVHVHVHNSCSAKPAQHECCKRECCEGFALQLFCWNLLSNRHVCTCIHVLTCVHTCTCTSVHVVQGSVAATLIGMCALDGSDDCIQILTCT